MSGSRRVHDLNWALSEVGKGDEVDLRAIDALVESDSLAVESALLAMVREKGAKFDVAALASRILVERDPNRDPSFVEEYWGGRTDNLRLVRRFYSYPPPGAHVFGFSRLNSFEPLKVYGRQLGHRFYAIRVGAAWALGDIIDPAALDPLALALNDHNWRVRKAAADSVRRLRHLVPSVDLSRHEAHGSLVSCLGNRRRAVRVAAARALAVIGDVQSVEQCRRRRGWRTRRSRVELEAILRGEIPPLPKTWPGDTTGNRVR